MTSKIVNMAERIKDAEDRLLDSLLGDEPIEDAGFSARVTGRIRRGIWLRRLTLPLAMLLGGGIAIKSLLQLGSVVTAISDSIPGVAIALPESTVTMLPMIIATGCLVLIGVVTFSLSEE